MSVVYFIQRDSDKAIKIGYSTNLMNRFQSLAQEFTDISLLGWIAGTMADERRYHMKFKLLRLDKEWFLSDPSLIDWIRQKACPIHHEEWAKALYESWVNRELSDKEAIKQRNQTLQLKFNYLVANDTQQSIRHAPLDPATYRNIRLKEAFERKQRAIEALKIEV